MFQTPARAVALLALLSTHSLNAAEVQVENFSSNDQCGLSPSFDVIDTSAYDPTTQIQGESLRVFFNEFFLSTQELGTSQKNCTLDAEIKIPAGFRFRPVSAAAEGSYSIQPKGESQGFIKVSYAVEPQGWSAEKSNELKPFSGEGEIQCIAQLQEAFFLSCSNAPSSINLHTNIDLRIEQKSPGFSQMDIDATRQNHDLAWKWELQPCSAAFEDHEFQSQFVAYNGAVVAANLRFTGSSGSFTTASFTGLFTEVRYLNNGQTVQGKWSVGEQGGNFVFHLTDELSGNFAGSWQDRINPSQGGTWNGQFLN